MSDSLSSAHIYYNLWKRKWLNDVELLPKFASLVKAYNKYEYDLNMFHYCWKMQEVRTFQENVLSSSSYWNFPYQSIMCILLFIPIYSSSKLRQSIFSNMWVVNI